MASGVKLRIMQPDLQQDAKFNYSAKAAVMQKYLTLSDRASGPHSTGVSDSTILIWPESAFPFFLTKEADAEAVAQQAGNGRADHRRQPGWLGAWLAV